MALTRIARDWRRWCSCDPFGDPVADLGSAIPKVVEVEPAHHRSIAVDEHEEDVRSIVLLFEKRTTGWAFTVQVVHLHRRSANEKSRGVPPARGPRTRWEYAGAGDLKPTGPGPRREDGFQ